MNLQDRRLHDRALELAAAAIDFSLSAAETAELAAHLAACPTCARRAAALRADASTLGRPLTLLPSRRVDDAVHAAIARRPARPQRLWLLAAAALLLVALLLGTVAVGAYLLRSWQTLPTTLVPTATTPVAVVSPGPEPSPAPGALPVRGSAREIGMRVQMAPGPGGNLFVAIPRPGGSVIALLDRTGAPRPGWPIVVKDSTWCDLVLPVADGSVRLVCTLENPDGNRFEPVGAVAFDSTGRLMPGWPADLQGFSVTGRVVGDDLTLFTRRSLDDVVKAGQPTTDGGLMTVAADGVISNGTRVPELGAGTVGPDGVAYGVTGDDASDIWAVDLSGMRTGWPVTFDGFASGPAFGPGGRVAVIVGSPTNGTSQVLVFDRDGNAVRGRSAAIPIVTVDENWGTAGGCPPWPKPPLVASDGTIFIFSEATPAVMAVDPSLKLMPGWPYRPAAPLVLRDERYVKEDAYCPSIAIPAVGPDTTLYLPLQAADATVGGSIVAVGPDGRLRPGGPVELKRPGAESWSVIVGSEGTVYVLAIEPEGVNASSATILAIAPDSTVLWTTTIIDP
jgi:hypothetical protein